MISALIRQLLSFAPDTLYCRHSSGGSNVGYQVCREDPTFLTFNADHRGCFGSYKVEENGTLTAMEQRCIDQWFGFCNFSGCQLSTQAGDTTRATTFVYCCCNSSECNMDSPDYHPDHRIYPLHPSHDPGKCCCNDIGDHLTPPVACNYCKLESEAFSYRYIQT